MKSCRLFFFAILSAVLNCFCNAGYIERAVQKDFSSYTYYDESQEKNDSFKVYSLVLRSDIEKNLYIDGISLVKPNDVSYVRSLLFNVINSYKCSNFFVHLTGDLNSNFRDSDSNILDKDIFKICKSFGFEKIYVDDSPKSRKDVFCASASSNHTQYYITSRVLHMFKSNANLKSNGDVEILEIRDI